MRILNFADGFESNEEPTKGSFSPANSFQEFESDEDFEEYKGAPASQPDVYFNSITKTLRLFVDSDWTTLILADVDGDVTLDGSLVSANKILATNADRKIESVNMTVADLLKLQPKLIGTAATPKNIVAGTGIDFTDDSIAFDRWLQTAYVKGNAAPVSISANPRIKPGAFEGQILEVIGCDNTNPVAIPDGSGVDNAGVTVNLINGAMASYYWNGTIWTLKNTNGFQ